MIKIYLIGIQVKIRQIKPKILVKITITKIEEGVIKVEAIIEEETGDKAIEEEFIIIVDKIEVVILKIKRGMTINQRLNTNQKASYLRMKELFQLTKKNTGTLMMHMLTQLQLQVRKVENLTIKKKRIQLRMKKILIVTKFTTQMKKRLIYYGSI